MLERYHWFVDKERRRIIERYSQRMRETFLDFPSVDLVEEASHLQNAMEKELMQIDSEEQVANVSIKVM